jgi:DNA repair protein RecO (recombination protein O)
MEFKYQGIILGKIKIGETDRIYTVYTRESGKVRLVAKGVRKPNAKLAGNLEPITYGEIFLAKGKGKGNITGAISLDNFLALKENISALEKTFYILRVFSSLIEEGEKDEKVFSLLLNYLKTLDGLSAKKETEEKMEILTFGFVFKLLHLLGYGFEMKKCVVCGGSLQSGENFFSGEKGGALCPKCFVFERGKVKISDEAIKFVRIFLENKIENLEKIKAEKRSLDNLKIITNEAVRWTIG